MGHSLCSFILRQIPRRSPTHNAVYFTTTRLGGYKIFCRIIQTYYAKYTLSFDCNIFLNPSDILSRLCISVIIARVLFQLDNIQVSSGINPKDIKPAIPQNKLPAIDTSLLIYTERHPKYRNANFHPLHQFIFEKLFAGELLFFYADVYDRFRLNISNGRLWDSDFYFANWLFSPLLQIL